MSAKSGTTVVYVQGREDIESHRTVYHSISGCEYNIGRAVRGGNGGQNIQKTCLVDEYSIKPFKIKGTNNFEKHLPPPYLLGLRLH